MYIQYDFFSSYCSGTRKGDNPSLDRIFGVMRSAKAEKSHRGHIERGISKPALLFIISYCCYTPVHRRWETSMQILRIFSPRSCSTKYPPLFRYRQLSIDHTAQSKTSQRSLDTAVVREDTLQQRR